VSGFESALSLVGDGVRLVTSPNGHGIAVWVLGIIFAWSGIAKLRRPTLAAMAIVDFGVSRRVIPRLGSALGVAELSLALLLVTGMLPRIFPTVTAGLLWLFVLLIVRSLWAGERFACFCFGDVDSELSHLTLVRTATLALLASVAAVVPPPVVAYPGFTVTDALQAASAMSIVGTIVLVSLVPRLLRWNKDPYTIRNAEVNE
jgi:methylamine utilization protein MauE